MYLGYLPSASKQASNDVTYPIRLAVRNFQQHRTSRRKPASRARAQTTTIYIYVLYKLDISIVGGLENSMAKRNGNSMLNT